MRSLAERCEEYTGNRGGECNAVERLAHCLRVEFICPYCGCDLRQAKSIHMDHILAQVYGGKKCDANTLACCGSCNCSKRHKLLAEFAAGRGDLEIIRRVKRIQRRSLPKYIAQAQKIIGE